MTEARSESFGFPRRMRIRSGADFRAIYGEKQAVHSKTLTLYWRLNHLDHRRLGLSVGRRHGNAVRRNRIKRVLREVFRLHQGEFPEGIDLVAIPRRGKDCADFSRCLEAFRTLGRRLEKDLQKLR